MVGNTHCGHELVDSIWDPLLHNQASPVALTSAAFAVRKTMSSQLEVGLRTDFCCCTHLHACMGWYVAFETEAHGQLEMCLTARASFLRLLT